MAKNFKEFEAKMGPEHRAWAKPGEGNDGGNAAGGNSPQHRPHSRGSGGNLGHQAADACRAWNRKTTCKSARSTA